MSAMAMSHPPPLDRKKTKNWHKTEQMVKRRTARKCKSNTAKKGDVVATRIAVEQHKTRSVLRRAPAPTAQPSPKLTREQSKAIHQELANRMIALRKRRGQTIEAVAKATGVSINELERVERGKWNPPFTLINLLAVYYGSTIDKVAKNLI